MPVRVRQCRPETGGGDFLRSGAVWMDTHGERGQLAIGSERVKSRSARGPEAPERGTLDVRLKPGRSLSTETN